MMMRMLHAILFSLLISTGITSPGVQGSSIRPSSDTSKCLDVRDGLYYDGTAVQISDCDGSCGQKWDIDQGSTVIRVTGHNFCLDATEVYVGVGMLIWECNQSPHQQWNFTNDGHIKVHNETADFDLCLDVPHSLTDTGVQVETYTCTDGESNQVWQVSSNFTSETPTEPAESSAPAESPAPAESSTPAESPAPTEPILSVNL